MIPNKENWPRLAAACLGALAVVLAAGLALAMSKDLKKGDPDAKAQKAAYALFKQKCLSCHVSVADPERKGKTKDEWLLVVSFMDKHYVELTDAEAARIVELLFALRRGTEKEAG